MFSITVMLEEFQRKLSRELINARDRDQKIIENCNYRRNTKVQIDAFTVRTKKYVIKCRVAIFRKNIFKNITTIEYQLKIS